VALTDNSVVDVVVLDPELPEGWPAVIAEQADDRLAPRAGS
jgi:hypothetical protein